MYLLCSAAGGEIFNQCVSDREDEAFSEEDVKRLMRQILEGVAFLHQNNIVHLDLKVSGDTHTVIHSYSLMAKHLRLWKEQLSNLSFFCSEWAGKVIDELALHLLFHKWTNHYPLNLTCHQFFNV